MKRIAAVISIALALLLAAPAGAATKRTFGDSGVAQGFKITPVSAVIEGENLLLTATIKNTSRKPTTFQGTRVNLYDVDGQELDGWMVVDRDDELDTVQLNPGFSKSGTMTFTAPTFRRGKLELVALKTEWLDGPKVKWRIPLPIPGQ